MKFSNSEEPKYVKKKSSDVSKASARADHRHRYEKKMVTHFTIASTPVDIVVEICTECGKWGKSRVAKKEDNYPRFECEGE